MECMRCNLFNSKVLFFLNLLTMTHYLIMITGCWCARPSAEQDGYIFSLKGKGSEGRKR